MGLPISKNPLITKWSTVFNILKNRTEISEEELNQLAKSIGFTVSALYDMLGLTASNETSNDFNPENNTSEAKNNGSTLTNVQQFKNNGPLLVRNAENPSKYIINPNYNAGLEILFNGQELTDDEGNKVGKMITKIDLAGTITAIGKGNGLVKLQVGDNMNSSGWNTKDGTGSDATVDDIATANGRLPSTKGVTNLSFSYGNWERYDVNEVLEQKNVPFKKYVAATSSNPYPNTIIYTSFKTPLKKTTDVEVKEHKIYTTNDSGTVVVANPTSVNINSYYEYNGYVHLNDGDNVWKITVYGPDGSTILRQATINDVVSINYKAKNIIPTENIINTQGQLINKTYTISQNEQIDVFKTTKIVNNTTQLVPSSLGSVVYVVGSNGIASEVQDIPYRLKDTTTGVESIVYGKMQVEYYYPKAVGARIIRRFKINLDEIVPNGNRVTIRIELNGNVKEQTFFYLRSEKPVISQSPSLGIQTGAYVQYSGVKYYSKDTVFSLTSASIEHLNYQLGVGSGSKLVLTDVSKQNTTLVNDLFKKATYPNVDTNVFGSPLTGSDQKVNNTTGYSNTNILLNTSKYVTDPGISLQPINAFATGSAVEAKLSNHLVNSYTDNPSDLVETFRSESKRLDSSTLGTYDSTKSILTTNTNELQIIPGIGLVYPSKNYTGFSPFSENYSTCTGTRYFVRKFIKDSTSSLPGAILIIEHNSSIASYLNAGTMKIEARKSNTSDWWDIVTIGTGKLGDAASTYEATSSTIKFNWIDGDSTGFFYIRISMNNSNASIKDIIIKKITYQAL